MNPVILKIHRWRLPPLLLLLAFVLPFWPCAVAAQTASQGDAPVHVTLGESANNLYGPWRFHTGDDPAWARPGFPDRSWETVDLHSDEGADPDLGTSGFVPGWTAQGHPEYSGFAWYRLPLQVEGARTALALKMPDTDDAYEVFVNGERIGHFGSFGHHRVIAYSALPRSFALPAGVRSGPVVIAIRVWMDSASRFYTPDAGGLHGPPVLGLAAAVAKQVQLAWDANAHAVGSGFLEMLVLLLAFVVALTHFGLERNDKAYLWLALVALATLLGNLVVLLVNFTTLLPQTEAILLKDAFLTPLRIGLWVLFWSSWFGLGTSRRLLTIVGALVFLLALGTAMLRPPLFGQVVPITAGRLLAPALLGLKLGLGVALLLVILRGFRRNRPEGRLALPAVLLAVAANYQSELRLLHLPITFTVLRFHVSLGELSTMFSLLLITVMGSRRFLLAQRRRVQYELEVRQASELQRVILPRKLPLVPGLEIDGEYRPSREVGGDFFQIIPHRADGSVLVLIGDVTGKGLEAGMLVALIVGAADTAARQNPDPHFVLQVLNERLCERGFASATCLALRLEASGDCWIVNAGHLAPYLNGRELAMEGALPLGTLPGLDFSAVSLHLHRGDTLLLLTDGVVEAQNHKGELFGFDRVATLINQTESVRDMADTVERFGQQDDILLLRLHRTAAAQLAAAAA